jgi:hypothetical protein
LNFGPKEQPEMMDQKKRDFIVATRRDRIDNWCVHPLYVDFIRFMDGTDPFNDDYYRFCRTFAGIMAANIDLSGKRIRETGGQPSKIIYFLKELGFDADGCDGDLRYELAGETGSVDIMLSFEVMEHIGDQRETCFDDIVLFRESGVRKFASEVVRVTKPGGALVMTTPNANSYLVLERLVQFEAPVLFRPHVREYTKAEIAEMFRPMVLTKYETHNSIFGFARKPHETRAFFEQHGWDPEGRGDLHFCVFRKPPIGPQPP